MQEAGEICQAGVGKQPFVHSVRQVVVAIYNGTHESRPAVQRDTDTPDVALRRESTDRCTNGRQVVLHLQNNYVKVGNYCAMIVSCMSVVQCITPALERNSVSIDLEIQNHGHHKIYVSFTPCPIYAHGPCSIIFQIFFSNIFTKHAWA